jgi:aspartate racemase
MTNKIGIIGGAGVAATNKLNELIEIELTKNGAIRDCHHPEIIVYQATQAPSRSMYLEGKGESFIDDYVDVAKKLKQIGSDILCMCCNTAHYAIDEIEEKSGIHIINLIEEVAKEVARQKIFKVGLIASDGCLRGKVYEKYFSRILPDVTIIYPDEKMQKEVTKGICNIKNLARFLPLEHPDRPSYIFTNICNRLFDKGAGLIVVGCTDIRVDFKYENTIDSLEVLAKTILNYWKREYNE